MRAKQANKRLLAAIFTPGLVGRKEEAEKALAEGANPNLRATLLRIPVLNMAIAQNRKGVVEALIEHGAKLNVIDMLGRSPLYMAAALPETTLLEVLLEKGASLPKTFFPRPRSPYYAALRNKEATELLLEHQLPIPSRVVDIAIRLGRWDVARELVQQGAKVSPTAVRLFLRAYDKDDPEWWELVNAMIENVKPPRGTLLPFVKSLLREIRGLSSDKETFDRIDDIKRIVRWIIQHNPLEMVKIKLFLNFYYTVGSDKDPPVYLELFRQRLEEGAENRLLRELGLK